MKHAIIHGFETPHTHDAILSLERDGLINISAWIGDAPHCTYNVYDLFSGRFDCNFSRIPINVLADIINRLYLNIYAYYRHYKEAVYVDIYELHNSLMQYLNFYYDLINKKSVDVILFSNIPHEGPDSILYSLAKILNIKTIICRQSCFPEKYFVVEDIDDFGDFESSVGSPADSFGLEQADTFVDSFTKVPFYMQEVKQTYLPPMFTWKNISSLRRFNRALSYRKRYRKYENNLKSMTVSQVPFSEPYVYFPLQLQPELTTCPMGGFFFDQVLAIESLSALLPEEWKVFIKENPKQTDFMRGEKFFSRLRSLSNVLFVPNSTSSHELIKKSRVVATVTGTAGIESLVFGKPVVVFGKTWYSSFPGVRRYSDDMQLDKLHLNVPSRSELSEHILALVKKLGSGVVDPVYAEVIPDYDISRNNQRVYETLKLYLR